MAKHMVTCRYCKKRFDANEEPFEMPTRNQYYHKKCWQKKQDSMTQEERDAVSFYHYAKTLFGEDYNYVVTKKLAERYIKENGYTYSGMEKALKWTYEIEKVSLDKANGSIGLLPYTYNKAKNYYYLLYLAQEANKKKDIELYKPQVRTIEIESPQVYIKPHRMFDMEEEE